jgi:nucleotide-binding universal stress UspA family protein
MSWQPIVVGVDASPEAATAAVFAVAAAQRAATTYRLVHASRNVPHSDRYPYPLLDEPARAPIVAAVGNRVPPTALDALTVREGTPAAVLNRVVDELGAELVVLGGKHHSTVGRWLGGSTGVNVARTTLVPVLVTVGAPVIRRVLVALDPSAVAGPTLAAAERYAALFGAKLRALSVVEPLPVLSEVPQPDMTEYYQVWEETLAHDVWPLIRAPGVETIVRRGVALDAIQREAAEWHADLLVVGSHGKGWVTRALVGSVTERLINHLPTSLLVVPARAAALGPDVTPSLRA